MQDDLLAHPVETDPALLAGVLGSQKHDPNPTASCQFGFHWSIEDGQHTVTISRCSGSESGCAIGTGDKGDHRLLLGCGIRTICQPIRPVFGQIGTAAGPLAIEVIGESHSTC